MIERYVFAVTRELPDKKRKEVADDLRALINDMMDDKDNKLSEEEKIEKVLRKLGDPKRLAVRYRGKERYLIGPNYFDRYIFVMKIVIVSILIGVSLAVGLAALFSTESTGEVIFDYLFTLFSATLQGAAWVTGIFALLEYYEVSIWPDSEQDKWDPSQLPELPEKKALISRGESVFSIIMTTIFLLLFFFLSDSIGIYYNLGSEFSFIPLFNAAEIDSYMVIIFLVFSINILIELIKIIKGRWTIKIAVITTVLNILSAALFISVINNMRIWNNDIILEIEQYVPVSFERMIFLTTVIVIVITIGESASALYRGVRYGA